jgi:pSer/pThr/pTyr-binding forkhead associated (FHA) protein
MAEQDSLPTLSFSISVDGTEAGTQEFEQEMVTIGKGGAAVLQISDEGLADLHAAVQVGDDGSVTLLDLGSESGTLLNGNAVNNSAISDGDEVVLGKTTIKLGVRWPEPEQDTDEGPAPIEADTAAPDPQVEEAEDVMDFILRSGTAESDMGIDRKAPKVLEIAELWSGTVLNVKHFDSSANAVYVGDRRAKPIKIASGLLTAILVLGAAFFMVKQISIPEPPRVPESDLALIQKWKDKAAEKAAEKAKLRSEELKKENEELTAEAEERMAKSRSKYDRKMKQSYQDAEKSHKEKQAEARDRHNRKQQEAGTTDLFKGKLFCLSVLSQEVAAEVEGMSSAVAKDRRCREEARGVFRTRARDAVIEDIRDERAAAEEERLAKLEPANPLRDYKDGWTANTKKAFEKAIKRNRNNIPLVPPQFEMFERPDYEDFIRDEMMPIAKEMAAKGELRQSWIDLYKDFEREYEIYDDLDEKRVVEDVVLATRIHREAGGEVLMLVAGMDPNKVYAMSRDGNTTELKVDDEVFLWGPSEDETAAREALYKEIHETLYLNSRVKARVRGMCDSAEILLGFDDHKDNFELNALFSECLMNRGKMDQSREHYALALELPVAERTLMVSLSKEEQQTGTNCGEWKQCIETVREKHSGSMKDNPTQAKADSLMRDLLGCRTTHNVNPTICKAHNDKISGNDFYLRALRVRARVLLKDAHDGNPELSDHDLMPVAKREGAMVAHEALRDFLIENREDTSSLRAADKGIFLLERERKREAERKLVLNTMLLAFFIFLLLPIGFGYDELRSRKLAQDFFVDSDNLPSDHFPIVEQSNGNVLVNFTGDSVGFIETPGGRTSTADLIGSGRAQPKQVAGQKGGYHQVELGADERFINDIGHVVFFIHRVHKAKVIPAPFGKDTDWLYLGVLAALLFLGGALGINLMLTPYDASQEVITIPDRFVELMVQEVEKEKKEKKPSGNEDAGEGAKAKEEEGKTGKKEHKLKKAKGSKVAIQKSELDKQIAESAGLLADLNQMTDTSMFGTGGLDSAVSSAVGGLIGSQYGQFGAGGLGSRGSGLGGGGTAAGLGGMGTRGTGMGASGYGRGAGFYGKKGGGAPGVGTGDPIILGALDKSIIDRIVKQHLAKIRYCYQKELNKNPKLFGKIVVKFVIAKDGSVSTASTKSTTLRNPIVEKCINSRFMRMRFPAPKGGGIVIVSYPFVFNSQGG